MTPKDATPPAAPSAPRRAWIRAALNSATRLRAVLPAACVATLAACTTLPPARPVATTAPSRSGTPEEPRGLPGDAPSPLPDDERAAPSEGSNEADAERGVDAGRAASNVLLERSRTARQAGSYDAAAASIERALRIAPNDPALWLELAEIRLASGDAQQASIVARKAASLAGGDREISARAARLIDAAER